MSRRNRPAVVSALLDAAAGEDAGGVTVDEQCEQHPGRVVIEVDEAGGHEDRIDPAPVSIKENLEKTERKGRAKSDRLLDAGCAAFCFKASRSKLVLSRMALR